MDVKQIIEKHLRERGCLLEDLVPCGEICTSCEGGYLQNLTDEEKREGTSWRLGLTKPPPPPPPPAPLRPGLTDDPNDPRIRRGSGDAEPTPQHEVYLVLSEEERAKGYVRPVRRSCIHNACHSVTTMSQAIAETYARNPKFYGATYCCACQKHLPVSEFVWEDGTQVGS